MSRNIWDELAKADPHGYEPPEDSTFNENDYENHLDDEYHKLKDEGEMR